MPRATTFMPSFDPAADPWGVAILASSAVFALSVFVLLAAVVTKTPKRSAGRIMFVGVLAFLGTSVGGTFARIQAADAKPETKAAPAPITIDAPPPPPDDGAMPGDPAGAANAGGADAGPADAGGDAAGAAEAGDGAGADGAGADGGGDPTAGAADADSPPGPSDTAATAPTVAAGKAPVEVAAPVAAVTGDAKAKLAHARGVVDDDKRCRDAEQVAAAFGGLKSITDEASRSKATALAKKLDGCRRKILAAENYRRRRERIDARNAVGDELPTRLKKDDSFVFVRLSGQSHEFVRIGGRAMTKARIDALVADGLLDELSGLGFAKVTFADGKNPPRVFEFEQADERKLGKAWLAGMGLDEPLTLD